MGRRQAGGGHLTRRSKASDLPPAQPLDQSAVVEPSARRQQLQSARRHNCCRPLHLSRSPGPSPSPSPSPGSHAGRHLAAWRRAAAGQRRRSRHELLSPAPTPARQAGERQGWGVGCGCYSSAATVKQTGCAESAAVGACAQSCAHSTSADMGAGQCAHVDSPPTPSPMQ